MFPSSGVFGNVGCPLAPRGLCERPHCFYKHAAGSREASTEGPAGVQKRHLHAASGMPFSDETQDDGFHELERLNKEIETVRQEVEVERKRLSGCQPVPENSSEHGPAVKYVPDNIKADRAPSNMYKTQAKATKYVVDNSKPRTDLEYDPLSNFSADLWCLNSSTEEQKVKHIPNLKPAPSATAYELKETVSCDFDEDDDCVLIIDDPLPAEGSSQALNAAHLLSGRSSQGEAEQMKSVAAVPASLDIPSQPLTKPEMLTPSSSLKSNANKNDNDCGGENKDRDQFSLSNVQDSETPAAGGGVIDLTGSVGAPQSGCRIRTVLQTTGTAEGKFPQQSNLPEKSEHHDNRWKNNACELPSIAEKSALQTSSTSLSPETQTVNLPQRHKNGEVQPQAPPAQDGVHSQISVASSQSSVPVGKKISGEVPRQTQTCVIQTYTSSVIHQEHTETVCSTYSNTLSTEDVKPSTKLHHQPLEKTKEVIVISSEDELNYSDLELSDTDPMEECYKIFMEANEGEGSNENDKRPEDELKPALNTAPLAGKKRVAHEAPDTEPVAKRRLQPQVLVPFRGSAASGVGSQPPLASKIQHIQQRASVQASSENGGQTLVSAHKKPETQNTPPALTAPPQNAYLPGRGTVIAIDSSLHLLVPQGALALPVTSSSSTASVLTPIGRAPMSTIRASQTSHPAVAVIQSGHSGASILIPAPARKPSLVSGVSAPVSSSPAPLAAAKSVPSKRKMKQHFEATQDKVPHEVRQRYVDLFTEEFLKTTPNVNEAFQKALAEEKVVYSRSMNKVKYQSVAVNALKRLRNQSGLVSNENNEAKSGKLRGNIPLNLKKLYSHDDADLYKCLKDYILSDERLIESNYPILNPEKRGCAVLFSGSKKMSTDPLKKICCRCGATYSVTRTGKHARQEECNYHYGKGVTKRVPGGVETRYSCCEGVMGAPGCQVFKLHVHDSLSLEGFVSTAPRSSDTSCPGVFSLSCAMCYTVDGLELSRATVVNSKLQVVYDKFVTPTSEVIDYNTRFSGVSEEDVKGTCTSLTEVQETLLSFISDDTILIGHSLERTLCLLKLLHGTVVDTSEVFPHRLGPPNKLSLHKLTAEYLRKIIQESACGRDTAEDAAACMELMLWKAKKDGKLKK